MARSTGRGRSTSKSSRGPRLGSDGELSEAAWQQQTIELGRSLGYLVYHVPLSKRVTSNGYPDNHYVHTKQPWHCYVELKRHDGMLSDAQIDMLDRLTACGVPCYVWVADKLYGPARVWQEASDILTHGPGRSPHPERTRWPDVLLCYPGILTRAQWMRRALEQERECEREDGHE